MTIADAPLWAQTPTGKVVRNLEVVDGVRVSSEPFWVDLVWCDVGDEPSDNKWASIFGADIPGGMYFDEARRLWGAIGDLLAIEAVDGVAGTPKDEPWDVDGAGMRYRVRHCPALRTGAFDEYGTEVSMDVSVCDWTNQPGEPDVTNDVIVKIIGGSTSADEGVLVKGAEGARALAFALLKAARVADMATGVADV